MEIKSDFSPTQKPGAQRHTDINVEMERRTDSTIQKSDNNNYQTQQIQHQHSLSDDHYPEDREDVYTPLPRKMVYIISFLCLAGSILFLIGIIDRFTADRPEKDRDLTFIIVGSICLIPGLFYGVKMIKVSISKDARERQDLINEFPYNISN